MPNDFENRVLVRRNARLLSAEEFQEIMEKGKSQMTQLPSMPFHPDFKQLERSTKLAWRWTAVPNLHPDPTIEINKGIFPIERLQCPSAPARKPRSALIFV
jgi:hypothetical protein